MPSKSASAQQASGTPTRRALHRGRSLSSGLPLGVLAVPQLKSVISRSSRTRAAISVVAEAHDALGAELLDVERGQRGAVGHRRAQQLVREAILLRARRSRRGDVADEAAGEGVAGAGRIDDALERVGGQREEALGA